MLVAPKRASVTLAYYRPDQALSSLIAAVKKAKLPRNVPVFLGTYGISKKQSDAIHQELPQTGRYAPVFSLVRKTEAGNLRRIWKERTPGQPGDGRYAGNIPTLAELERAAGGDKAKRAALNVRWGVEVGRRLRDQIEAARKSGVRIDSWQLDEIWPSAANELGGGSKAMREYFRGVMHGLARGRPERRDGLMRGSVHVANFHKLARLPLSHEVKLFWKTMNASCERVIGETYPRFEGDPRAKARQAMAPVEQMRKASAIQRAVASKFVLGMTPGFHDAPMLGGQKNDSLAQADEWRDRFMEEALRRGAAGLSEYNWMPHPTEKVASNENPRVIDGILEDIAQDLRAGPERRGRAVGGRRL